MLREAKRLIKWGRWADKRPKWMGAGVDLKGRADRGLLEAFVIGRRRRQRRVLLRPKLRLCVSCASPPAEAAGGEVGRLCSRADPSRVSRQRCQSRRRWLWRRGRGRTEVRGQDRTGQRGKACRVRCIFRGGN